MAADNPNISSDQQTRLSLPDEQVVQLVVSLIDPGEKELLNRRKRYDHSYDVYRASEKRPASLEPWQSKLRVPYGQQVLDTAMVNIVTGFPRCLVHPRHPDVELNAKAMQVVIDYQVGEDHMVEKQPLFVQQGLIYGATVAKNHWLYQTTNRSVRNFMGLSPSIGTQEVVLRDGPTFEPWNIYDCWWDTNARDVDSARYFVLRSWLSKEQLLQQECRVTGAHTKAQCDGIYHNLPDLFKVGPQNKPAPTAQQNFLGGQQDRVKGMFEILEIWTNDTVTVLGSRKVLLRNEPNPYWHGKKPIVLAQTRPDGFEMQGISETELVDHLQNAQWTLQNMTIDNLHMTVMRGITYREGGVTDPNKLQLKPRFKWAVVDHDDVKPFEVAPISSDVYTERQRLLADMQLVTGINPYVSGSDLSSVDQNTATGVTALQEVASRLLRFKASQIQYKGYQRTFEMWGDMTQQFMDKDVYTRIVGPTGQPEWLQVGPRDVAGHFRYKLEGSEESLSRQQERGEAIALLNAFAPLFQLGIINPKPILEKVAMAYGFESPESLFQPPQAQPPAAPGPPQQQLPPGPPEGPGGQPEQGGAQIDPQLAAALARLKL